MIFKSLMGFLLFILLSFSTMAQVPTQTQLAKRELFSWFIRSVGGLRVCSEHLTGMGDFALLKTEAPKAFQFFKIFKERFTPSPQWQFAFSNSGSDFVNVCQKEFGFCAGFSSLNRDFNLLAYYDPQNFVRVKVPDKLSEPKEYQNFYRRLFGLMMQKKSPVIIPGFKNLGEISSDELLQPMMRELIVKEWLEENISLSGFRYLQSTMTKPKSQDDLYQKIQLYLSLNFNPRLVVPAKSEKLVKKDHWIHVVKVTGISEKKADGSFMIDVWDVSTSTNQSQIEVLGNGEIRYVQNEIADLVLPHWEELEISKILINQLSFYSNNENLLKRLGYDLEAALTP